MRRYYNLAYFYITCFATVFICFSIYFIIGCVVLCEGNFDGMIIMCFSAGIILILYLFTILFPNHLIRTYYDNEQIKQNFLWRKKKIQYKEVKEIYIINSYIYISSKNYNLNLDSKEPKLHKILYKTLKNEMLVMINSQEVNFIKNIPLENIQIYIFKNNISKILNKYFS